MPKLVTIPAHQVELADERGCYAYMGYLGMSLHCGMHGLCPECRKKSGEVPEERGLARRREELDRWLRAELALLGVTEQEVLEATDTSYGRLFWFALDTVRRRNGYSCHHSGHADGLRPALVKAIPGVMPE